jgi:hypothetical protein
VSSSARLARNISITNESVFVKYLGGKDIRILGS